MAQQKPDIMAKIRMYSHAEGGKCKVISDDQFGCPLYFEGEGFDCRLLLTPVISSLHAGDTAEVPIQFLYPEYIKSRLKKGDKFTLWDLRTFAEGEILVVFKDAKARVGPE
jgi:hypothetical protein